MPKSQSLRSASSKAGARVAEIAELFERGEYTKAGALYDEIFAGGGAPFDASAIRARVHMRQNGELPKAIALLNRLRKSATGTERIRAQMLLGDSYATIGDFKSADTELRAAWEAAKLTKDKHLIAEVAYRYGRRYTLLGTEPQLGREFLQPIRDAGSIHARLNALHLESWILFREGRTHDQARILMQMLQGMDPDDPAHMEHRLRGTQTLAALAREHYLPEAIPIVERHLGGVEWPVDFTVAFFQATKAVGWAKALQGDYFNAFRYLRRSAQSAPNLAWQAMALCDRAYLAQTREQDVWFRQELSDAEEAADAAHWENCADEAVMALLGLAELLAPIDAAKASEYLARFREGGSIRTPRSLMKDDPRLEAMIEYSTGVVDAHLGNRKAGIARLKAALEAFELYGLEWRGGRAALRLYDFSKKRAYLATAERLLHHYGSSWLGEELRKRTRTPDTRAAGLTPMQDKVFRLICQGLTNAEIAEMLGLSPMTIANHAKAVLKAFAVSSRHALIAEAMRRNII
jgi:DNA-binding CsgD family transcriptional regulator